VTKDPLTPSARTLAAGPCRGSHAEAGFTGGVSSSPTVPPEVPAPSADGPATPQDGPATPPAGRPWSPWQEARRDWRWAAGVVGVLAVVGVPLGVLWWALAPRADYKITGSGPVVIGNPSEELLIADDGIFVIIVAGLGLLAGVLTWLFRRHRGVAGLLAVAFGTLAGSAVAWRIGELLGPPPSRAALRHVGGRVTTSLTLGMLPALAVGPFVALLVWLVATLYSRGEGLGRPAPVTDAPGARPAPQESLSAEGAG
jgi:Protein of unknown function (DUF2567)